MTEKIICTQLLNFNVTGMLPNPLHSKIEKGSGPQDLNRPLAVGMAMMSANTEGPGPILCTLPTHTVITQPHVAARHLVEKEH